MSTRISDEIWFSAADCAKRLGLTVRALRLYERYKLIAPRRTLKGWRLYGAEEVARLNEILALKQLGLSLSKIAELLSGRGVELAGLLETQRLGLEERRLRAERGLELVASMQAKCDAGDTVSTDDLMKLAETTSLGDASAEALAWRRYEQARPRTAVKIAPELYGDYVGFYLLEMASAAMVTHVEGRLFIRIAGTPIVELFPEGADRFFVKVFAAQIAFERDAQGAVSGFVQHQHGITFQAARVDEATALAVEDARAERERTQTPLPGGAEILRGLIDECLRGEPTYDRMMPYLAASMREQIPYIRRHLTQLGGMLGLSFTGVLPDGSDAYEVIFEKAKMVGSFALTQDGRIGLMRIGPTVDPYGLMEPNSPG